MTKRRRVPGFEKRYLLTRALIDCDFAFQKRCKEIQSEHRLPIIFEQPTSLTWQQWFQVYHRARRTFLSWLHEQWPKTLDCFQSDIVRLCEDFGLWHTTSAPYLAVYLVTDFISVSPTNFTVVTEARDRSDPLAGRQPRVYIELTPTTSLNDLKEVWGVIQRVQRDAFGSERKNRVHAKKLKENLRAQALRRQELSWDEVARQTFIEREGASGFVPKIREKEKLKSRMRKRRSAQGRRGGRK